MKGYKWEVCGTRCNYDLREIPFNHIRNYFRTMYIKPLISCIFSYSNCILGCYCILQCIHCKVRNLQVSQGDTPLKCKLLYLCYQHKPISRPASWRMEVTSVMPKLCYINQQQSNLQTGEHVQPRSAELISQTEAPPNGHNPQNQLCLAEIS